MDEVSSVVFLEIMAEIMGLKNAPPMQVQTNAKNMRLKLSNDLIM